MKERGKTGEVHEPLPLYEKKFYTVAEYLEMEKVSLSRNEYYKGEIFAMSGAGPRHNIIFSNLFISLGQELRGKSCQPYGSDMRINIPENSLFTYPDISVICGEIIASEEDEDTATQPTVIFEILSPSTKNYDRGEKFMFYRAIPTLRDYILIDSENIHAEHFFFEKQNDWRMHEYKILTDKFRITSINVELFLKEIYDRTKL